jgi:APA family basic amino acid/polyamine antiporter
VSHVAGEVLKPGRNLPLGLALGVTTVTAVYLLVNFAYLRVVPLEQMRSEPTTIALTVAGRAFGQTGGLVFNGLLLVSIFGALGGLVMTLPRLFFAAASDLQDAGKPRFFGWLSTISSTAVPTGSIVFCAAMSIAALLFFGSFSRIVNSFVAPLQLANVLLVAAVFRLRRRAAHAAGAYRTPGYPVVPLVYIGAIALFVSSAILYQPFDTLIGVALTATGVPFYWWLSKRKQLCAPGVDPPPSAIS